MLRKWIHILQFGFVFVCRDHCCVDGLTYNIVHTQQDAYRKDVLKRCIYERLAAKSEEKHAFVRPKGWILREIGFWVRNVFNWLTIGSSNGLL
jgi:hypothetical protein